MTRTSHATLHLAAFPRIRWIALVGLTTLASGCGSKKKQTGAADSPQKTAPNTTKASTDDRSAPALEAKTMGLEKLYHLNYRYGRGDAAYDRARAHAARARKQPANAATHWKAAAREALAATTGDPHHLDAQLLLAVARAQLGKTDEVAEPLSTALAADWLHYGPSLAKRPALAAYFQTPQGRAVLELNKTYKEQFLRKAHAGIMLVGRRSKFREPTKPGKQWSATRAELFAYDVASKRYLRLTHTGETVAAWLMSPSGDEIAYVAHKRVVWPEKTEDQPLLAHTTIGILSAETFQPRAKPVHLTKPIAGLRLHYRTGDELVAATLETMGRYRIGDPRYFVYDKGAGKLRKLDAKLDAKSDDPHSLEVAYDWVTRRQKLATHIQAEELSATFRLLRTKQTISLPDGEMVDKRAFTWSPDGSYLAFHTMARPCDNKPGSTLYVVEAATGKLKNLLRGHSEFGLKWIDNQQLVYEDPDGNLRIYDVVEQRQTHALNNRPGLSLSGVAAKKGPLCHEDLAAKPDAPLRKVPAAAKLPAPTKPVAPDVPAKD